MSEHDQGPDHDGHYHDEEGRPGSVRGHGHGHGHGLTATAANRSRLVLVLCITVGVMLVQAVGGLLSGSLALLADAGHMLTDATGVGIALLAATLATRPARPAREHRRGLVVSVAAEFEDGGGAPAPGHGESGVHQSVDQ